jgi:GTP-binding protein EngB required for normal cell division
MGNCGSEMNKEIIKRRVVVVDGQEHGEYLDKKRIPVNLYVTSEVKHKGVVVISIDHSGSTALIRSLTLNQCSIDDYTIWRGTSGDMICYDTIESRLMTGDRIMTSYIDAGSVLYDNIKHLKRIMSPLLTINAFLIVARLGRWTKKMDKEIMLTLKQLKAINADNLLLVLSHADIYNDESILKFTHEIRNKLWFDGNFRNVISVCSLSSDSLTIEGISALTPSSNKKRRALLQMISDCNDLDVIRDPVSTTLLKNNIKNLQSKEDQKNKSELFSPRKRKTQRFQDSVDRKILILGQSGAGKSSIAKIISQNSEIYEGKLNSSSVTKRAVKSGSFTSRNSMNMDVLCQIVDTPGVGDVDNISAGVIQHLVDELFHFITEIDVVLFVFKLMVDDSETITQLKILLSWMKDIFQLKHNNVIFTCTFCDFYNDEYRNTRIKQLRDSGIFCNLESDMNVILASTPNISEIKMEFMNHFSAEVITARNVLLDKILEPRERLKLKVGDIQNRINKIRKKNNNDG